MAQLIFVSAAQVKELQARFEKLFAQDSAEQARLLALEERLRAEEQRPREKGSAPAGVPAGAPAGEAPRP